MTLSGDKGDVIGGHGFYRNDQAVACQYVFHPSVIFVSDRRISPAQLRVKPGIAL